MAPAAPAATTRSIAQLPRLLSFVALPGLRFRRQERSAPRPSELRYVTPTEARRADAQRVTGFYRDPAERESLVEADIMRTLEMHMPR